MHHRNDIQALRGLAVLIVILYHADLKIINYGYLGVDVFFVISGYLITSIIANDLKNGSFSFSDFYRKRAVRLLPVAFAVLFPTFIAAQFLLTAPEFGVASQTFIASLFYASNIQLWQAYDYFSPSADLNPFLHSWSLAVEEQFYLFWPLALFLLKDSRWRIALLAAITLGSLILCLVLVQYRPSAAFYLLPTRGWELGIGALVSQIGWNRQDWSARQCNAIGAAALAVIVFTVLVHPEGFIGLPHPGLDAILVCLGTATLLVTAPAFLNTGFVSRWLGRLGDISYSLYLVHWPVLVLLKASHFNQLPPWHWRAFGLIAAIALSVALYRWVERPARSFGRQKPQIAIPGLIFASVALAAVSIKGAADIRQDAASYTAARAATVGLSRACNQFGKDGHVRPAECRTSETAETIVWGNSYAMHIVPWLEATNRTGIEQATMQTCSPILGVALIPAWQTIDWPARCMAFNQQAYDHILRSPGIRTVVMSSPLYYLFNASSDQLVWSGQHEGDVRLALNATIAGLLDAGKRVVFVSPTPTTEQDTSLCLERSARNLFTWGSEDYSCEISRTAVDQRQGELFAWLDSQLDDRVIYVDLRELLCDETTCANSIAGTPLYRDTGHLSIAGSQALSRLYDLGAAAEGTPPSARNNAAAPRD